MRGQLISAALGVATWLFLAPAGAATSGSTTCAVRLRAQDSGHHSKPGALQSVLSAAGALRARPLLAGGHVTPTTDVEALAASAGEHPLAVWFVLEFRDTAARDAAVAALRQHPALTAVEPIRTFEIPRLSNAPGPQTRLPAAIPWNIEQVRAPEALAEVQPDSSIIVAVIDSGADLQHPDLRHRLWRNDDNFGNDSAADDDFDQNGDGFVESWEKWDDDDNGYIDDLWGYDFTDAPGQGGVGDALERDAFPDDESGHGTHVAGIIAADGDLTGVAPFVQLMVVRAAFNRSLAAAALETDDAAAAIAYAVDNGADVLNLSFGDTEDSRLIRDAIDYAISRDVIVVAAAGNAGSDVTHYPSAHPGVIGVGASNRARQRAAFSNFGPGVELVAPGEESPFPGPGIVSLSLDGGTRDRRGTSMSAPHVTGVAAIVLSRADRPDARRTRALLLASAQRDDGAAWSADLGHGIVDALAAVRRDDDTVVHAIAPAQPYHDGRFTLVGTVLSGEAPAWGVAVRPLGGAWIELGATQRRQVVADTLVSAPLPNAPEGDWEYRITAQLGNGQVREAHGAFVVDASAPVVNHLDIASAWRRAQPRWRVEFKSDDPVVVSARDASDARLLLTHPGFNRFAFVETAAHAVAGNTWNVTFENPSGLVTTLDVAAPPALAPWPEDARVQLLDSGSFFPEPVVGVAPDGERLVWGRVGGRMQAWSVRGDQLVLVYDAGIEARPVASGDVNGDGAADLLYQDRPTVAGGNNIHWMVTRAPDLFPDFRVSGATVSRALGFYDLDDDPALETLLSTEDELFVYDDAVGREPVLMQTLENPSQTFFNTYGADAAVGDIDGDGRTEIVIGDSDGAISVFERGDSGDYEVERVIASGGNYAYEYAALPEGGFVVGRQRTSSVGGDGFTTIVYDFINYDASGAARRVRSFLARLNVLEEGVMHLRSSASGDDYLVLANENDIYLARGATEPREHVTFLRGYDGDLPAIADFDADGHLEIVTPDRFGFGLYRFFEDSRGPYSLSSESLGPTRLRLHWQSGSADTFRVERFGSADWELLGETTSTTWVDSTLAPLQQASYRVQAVVGGEVRGTTRTVTAQARPRPELRNVDVTSPSSLRLRFSQPLHRDSLRPYRLRVVDADAVEHAVVSLALAETGFALEVTLLGTLACGAVDVTADSLRDVEWGLLQPPTSSVQATRVCSDVAFHVVRADVRPDAVAGFRIAFSRAPAAAALASASYHVRWDGKTLAVVSVEAVDETRFDLTLADPTPLLGLGIPYEISVTSTLQAADDGALLADAGTVHRVYVDGHGGSEVFAYPNPARAEDAEVVFADVTTNTRIRIYNLEGELVRELDDARGGGIRWDLRRNDGRPVASGVYLFVARDPQGTTHGRVAILK